MVPRSAITVPGTEDMPVAVQIRWEVSVTVSTMTELAARTRRTTDWIARRIGGRENGGVACVDRGLLDRGPMEVKGGVGNRLGSAQYLGQLGAEQQRCCDGCRIDSQCRKRSPSSKVLAVAHLSQPATTEEWHFNTIFEIQQQQFESQ